MLDDLNTDFVKGIPYKRVLRFGHNDSSNTTTSDDVYFDILCYDVFGSLNTDNVTYFQTVSELQYKDP
jgi:hypothetical protein